MVDIQYTNGAIAVKERFLLGEKLLRCTEMSAEELLRTVKESGFGGGAEAESLSAGEELCAAEERDLDGFIRAYAPSRAIAEYLLAPRDFHNLKALAKAKLLGTDPAPMLAPEGLHSVAELQEILESGAYSSELSENPTGAEIGAAFDRALFAHLRSKCKGSPLLKRLLAGKADRQNILIALRAPDEETAEANYLSGGKLGKRALHAVFAGEADAVKAPYAEFYGAALRAKEANRPFTEAERMLDSFEAEYFRAHRLELEGKEPFLFYVFRRRAEISNVRILFVCVNAGLKPQEIAKRLRALN